MRLHLAEGKIFPSYALAVGENGLCKRNTFRQCGKKKIDLKGEKQAEEMPRGCALFPHDAI